LSPFMRGKRQELQEFRSSRVQGLDSPPRFCNT
jgi:hypothetical protein